MAGNSMLEIDGAGMHSERWGKSKALTRRTPKTQKIQVRADCLKLPSISAELIGLN
jgi:hypothetical protein